MAATDLLSTHAAQRAPAALSTRLRRRAVIGAAAGALAALLAACSRPEGDTTFRPARTATPAGARSDGTTAPVYPTEAPPSTIVGTLFPTPKSGAPVPDLLRMLGFVPNAQDATGGLGAFLARWKGTLSFANLAAVKRLYGYDAIRAFGDLQAQNVSAKDYTEVTGGCYLTDFTGLQYSQGQYRAAFGFDIFQVDREISAGQPPDVFSRMEGTFDAAAIAAMLQAGGYTRANWNGTPFFTVRGDGEPDLADPRGRLALGRMNRVAVDGERITAAPSTEVIAATLDAEAKRTAALDATSTLRALATVLSAVTSMATIPPGASDVVASVLRPGQLAATTQGWSPLHAAELSAMGYTDAGNNWRTMHVALVYANPSDAAADAPELVKRLMGYRFLRTQQTLLPTYATAVTSRTATVGSKGVLVADIALTPGTGRSRLWIDMLMNRDTLFLVPQPLNALASPPPVTPAVGTASGTRPATPRASGTP